MWCGNAAAAVAAVLQLLLKYLLWNAAIRDHTALLDPLPAAFAARQHDADVYSIPRGRKPPDDPTARVEDTLAGTIKNDVPPLAHRL